MNMRFFALLIMCLIASCSQNSEPEQKNDTVETVDVDSNNIISDQERLKDEFEAQRYFIWEIDFDNKTITRSADFSNVNLSTDSVIKGLNMKYRNISLKKINFSNDTLYTRILDS